MDDFSSTPDQLLNLLLTQEEAGLTNFDAALKEAEQTMQSSFSSERFVTSLAQKILLLIILIELLY